MGIKYLNWRGEILTGFVIFAATLALGRWARWSTAALFITSALILVLLILVDEQWAIGRHTALPVLLSAVALAIARGRREHHETQRA